MNIITPRGKFSLLLMLILAMSHTAHAQHVALKTNLLYDATTTPNAGAEFRLSQHSSVQAFYGINPWKFAEHKKLRHWAVMPEYRYWLNQTFRGTFIGVHGVGGEFNLGGVKLPLGIFPALKDNHYEGSFYGGGLTLGHAWPLSRHWSIEAAIGIGYARYQYKQYENVECGALLADKSKNYFGPTKLALNLVWLLGGKKPQPEPQPVVEEVPIVLPPALPDYQLAFFTPQTEAVKNRELSGSAFLDFPVGKTVINRDYRNNRHELDKVMATIDTVRTDPNTTIDRITIHGYASPEGSFASNSRLAEGRAQAFRDYINSLIQLPDHVFSVSSTPEDWDGLRRMVSQSSLARRDELLQVIDADLTPDEKEKRLRTRYADDYRTLLADYFPALRHSDYTVAYTIRSFSVDEARQIIRQKPQQLSLNEMFLVAQTYVPGSQDYIDVFETAVRMYPDDPTANLNAAVIALQRDDLRQAERYLQRAGQSPEALNARGVLAAKQGQKTEAARLFEQSATPEARHNMDELRK